jgi:tRNA G18 (ribose-2'-O)-methylase SpoU
MAPPYGTPSLHLFLDNLRSTYNVGSLFRTADGVGVEQIHLCGITPTPGHPKVAKTALGAETRVGWRYYRNALQAAAELKAAGVQLWALEIHPQARSLFEMRPLQDHALALIIGNEVAGIDPGLLAASDQIVQLPMLGHKRSLNVASAGAIALYQLRFGIPSSSPTSFHQ